MATIAPLQQTYLAARGHRRSNCQHQHYALCGGRPFVVLALLSLMSSLVVLPQLVHADGSVPEGFIDEIVTSTKAMSGMFCPNPRNNNEPMMVLNEKNGLVHVLEDPDNSAKDIEILDLQDHVCTNGERGLQSMIAHPDFSNNRWIYAFYTKHRSECLEDPQDGPWNVVMRFTMDAETLLLDINDAEEIWRGPPMDKRMHNGGALAFGNDGKLYITTGDGGDRLNAGTLKNVHGSILRLNDDGSVPNDNPYTIASGYTDSYRCADSEGRVPNNAPNDSVCAEIFSYGLRNPFRISMDPNTKDKVRFSIGDVGAQDIEALYYGGTDYKGANYGWPKYEGGVCTPGDIERCNGLDDSSTVAPFHWYQHISYKDGGCVAASVFVPEGLWPSLYKFLFIDFVFLKVYNLELNKPDRACTDCYPPTPPTRNETFYRSFQKQGENVNEARMTSMWFGPYKDTMALYISKYGTKETILRIRYTGSKNKPPTPLFDFTFKTDIRVEFDASRSFDPENDELTYEWNYGDGSANQEGKQTEHEYEKPGEYIATLIVTDSTGNTQQDFKTVKIGQLPTVSIITPSPKQTFFVGEILQLSGEGTDSSGNLIPDQQLEWEVRQHHADHFHPFLDTKSGNNIELYPAPEPEDYLAATNSFLRVLLTATDVNGLSNTVSVDVHPTITMIDIQTNPQGMQVLVDEYSIRAPTNVTSWLNYNLPLHVEDQPPYLFKAWSDGVQNRSRTSTLFSDQLPARFIALFCLDLENMCVGNEDCCSENCDDGVCKPQPITETPTASPPKLSLSPPLAPDDGSTLSPTVVFVLSPPTDASDERPPLEIDANKPPLDVEGDASIQFNDAEDGFSLGSTDSLANDGESSVSNDIVSGGMPAGRAVLVSFVVIASMGLFAFCFIKWRRHEKEKRSEGTTEDSFYGDLQAEKDISRYSAQGINEECIESSIQAASTGSTFDSPTNSASSSNDDTHLAEQNLKNPQDTADICCLPVRGLTTLISEESTKTQYDVENQGSATASNISVSECNVSVNSNDLSSIVNYRIPHGFSEQTSVSQEKQCLDSTETSEVGRLSETSLLLEPSSMSLTNSHQEDVEVLGSVVRQQCQRSLDDLLFLTESPPSEFVLPDTPKWKTTALMSTPAASSLLIETQQVSATKGESNLLDNVTGSNSPVDLSFQGDTEFNNAALMAQTWHNAEEDKASEEEETQTVITGNIAGSPGLAEQLGLNVSNSSTTFGDGISLLEFENDDGMYASNTVLKPYHQTPTTPTTTREQRDDGTAEAEESRAKVTSYVNKIPTAAAEKDTSSSTTVRHEGDQALITNFYPQTPTVAILTTPSASKMATYTGATVSPTPEKSMVVDEDVYDSSTIAKSVDFPPDANTTVQRLVFMENDREEHNNMSLYSL